MKKFMFLLMAVLIVTACKKDDDDDNNTPPPPTFEEKLVGTYVFSSGIFNQDVTMINVPPTFDTVTFPQGSDATLIVGSVLLGDSPCDDPANTAIEMREDFSLYYVCLGEANELQMGIWSADEAANSITLTVDSDLGAIAIPITEIVLENNVMKGNINGLPVPVDITLPVGPINIQFTSVAVEFTKVD